MAATLTTHPADCMCVSCLMADMDAHLATMGMDPEKFRDAQSDGKTYAERTRYAKPGQTCGNGVVRLVSPKQVKYIKGLMAQRDTRNLVRLPGSEDIERMSLRGARDLIDRLLACPVLPETTERMATEGQISYLRNLLVSRDTTGVQVDMDHLTFAAATAAITELKDRPAKTAGLPMGIYRKADGSIVRTQLSRENKRMYGKVLNRSAGDAWVYQGNALSGLTAANRLTEAEVAELSIELGECCCCGRTLTATVDGVGPAARVIGPICAAKYGYAG